MSRVHDTIQFDAHVESYNEQQMVGVAIDDRGSRFMFSGTSFYGGRIWHAPQPGEPVRIVLNAKREIIAVRTFLKPT